MNVTEYETIRRRRDIFRLYCEEKHYSPALVRGACEFLARQIEIPLDAAKRELDRTARMTLRDLTDQDLAAFCGMDPSGLPAMPTAPAKPAATPPETDPKKRTAKDLSARDLAAAILGE